MTRFLLTLLLLGLIVLAAAGALLEAVRGKRPALIARREPALA
jgi:hypothetical protein